MSARKVRINLMDLSKFMDEVGFNDVQCVLDNFVYAAALETKTKNLNVNYDGLTYKFKQVEKILRKDLLELTYEFKGEQF